MTSTYFLDITKQLPEENDNGVSDEQIALVHGDLDEILYVGRRAVNKLAGKNDGEYSLEFIETEHIGDVDGKRSITRLTSDGDTVATVLKGKLKQEKDQRRAAESTTDAGNDGQPTPLVAEKQNEQY